MLIRYCQADMGVMLAIGSCTILMAGLGACAESDLKKVVALSTLSQLGVMMVSLGAQEKSFCFQHLLRHAYFKSLLFICVGICIHSIYGRQDFRRFGILSPALFASVFATVANFSLIGFVYTAGFHTKDGIIEILYTKGSSSCFLCFFLLAIGLTTCYTIKMQSMIVAKSNMSFNRC